jgi:hypothetical protein
MPLGRAFPILLGAAVRFAPLCALRGTLGSASITTPGGECTPRIALLQRLRNFPRARRTGFRTGFYRGVGAPTLRNSGPLWQIETFVTFCGMVGLRRGITGEGLRSVGAAPTSPIQERVLYPAHRSLFIGPGDPSEVRIPGPWLRGERW